MLLASDIGGTKTLLGLFAPAPDRPSAIEVGEFVTLDYDGLEPMVREFLGALESRPAFDHRGVHRRRRRGDGSGGAADERALARRRRSGGHRARPEARRSDQRPRSAGLRRPGPRAERAGGAATGNRRAGRQRGGDRGRYRDGHRDAAQRRRAVRAVCVRGRPRRLRRAHAARARARRRSDARLRPGRRRARHLRARTGQHLSVHPSVLRYRPDAHARTRSRRPSSAPASGRVGDYPRTAWTHLRVGARGALPALRGGLRHVRRRPTDRRRGTWRCARSPRPASISAAASRPRSCRRSNRVCSSKRSAPRNRWRIWSRPFPSR